MLVHASRVEGGCYRGNGESSYGGLEPRGELQKPLDPRWVKRMATEINDSTVVYLAFL
jgi:hypothetical protein